MNLSVQDNRVLNTLLYSVSDIERVADHAMSIARAAAEMNKKSIVFSKQAQGELAVLEQAVLDIVDRTVAAYEDFNRAQAIKIEPQEQVIDALVREVKSRHVRRLRDGLCSVEYGFVLEDLLTACDAAELIICQQHLIRCAGLVQVLICLRLFELLLPAQVLCDVAVFHVMASHEEIILIYLYYTTAFVTEQAHRKAG